MAKQLPAFVRDALARSDWKPKNVGAPLYTWIKDDFEIDIIPGLNREFSVQISKMSSNSAINSLRLNSDGLEKLLKNPYINYKN